MVREVLGAKWRPADLPAGRALVLFTADWCGYCRRFEAHFRSMRDGWMVDISDEDDPLWDSLGIQVVPTVILFVDGEPAKRWAGVLSASHMADIQAAMRA